MGGLRCPCEPPAPDAALSEDPPEPDGAELELARALAAVVDTLGVETEGTDPAGVETDGVDTDGTDTVGAGTVTAGTVGAWTVGTGSGVGSANTGVVVTGGACTGGTAGTCAAASPVSPIEMTSTPATNHQRRCTTFASPVVRTGVPAARGTKHPAGAAVGWGYDAAQRETSR